MTEEVCSSKQSFTALIFQKSQAPSHSLAYSFRRKSSNIRTEKIEKPPFFPNIFKITEKNILTENKFYNTIIRNKINLQRQ